MRLLDQYDGAGDPFEGDRTVVWRSLPAGAVVTRAFLTLAPVPPPGEGDFFETLVFGASQALGATIQQTGSGVLVDFHARRAAMRITGLSGIASKSLAVDIGGGVFLAVGADGTLLVPPNPGFDFSTGILPGIAALRLRLSDATVPDDPSAVSVGIATMPSNITLRFGKALPFFSRTGELASATTTPDITASVQRALADATSVNGYFVVPLVVHSDTLGRLAITLDVTYLLAAPLMPAGLREVVLPFGHASVTTTAAAALQASLPAGAVVQSPETAFTVRGAFEASRIVHGATGPTEAGEPLACSATDTIAQRLLLPDSVVVSGIDLFVVASGPAARLALDLRADADGKPGASSRLAKPALLDIAGDPTGQPRWLSVALKPPAQMPGGTPFWLVAQAVDGAARIGTQGSADAGQGPLRSTDAGFSWRRAGAATPLLLRLRTLPDRFQMPIDFVAGEGAGARRVSLAAYDPMGKIDAVLDRPEIASAVQDALRATTRPLCAQGEILANPDFAHWTAQGGTLAARAPIHPQSGHGVALVETFFDTTAATLLPGDARPQALAFSADGAALFVASGGTLGVVDPGSGKSRPVAQRVLAQALVADPRGSGVLAVNGRALLAIDAATGAITTIAQVDGAACLAVFADGTRVVVVGSNQAVSIDLATRTPLYDLAITAPAPSVALSPDGATLALIDQSAGRVATFAAATGAAAWSAAVPPGLMPQAVAFAADGSGLYVAAIPGTSPAVSMAATASVASVTILMFDTRGRQGQTVVLAGVGGLPLGFAVKPQGDRVYVAATPLALDPSGGRLAVGGNGGSVGVIAVGARVPSFWTLTAGQIAPVAAQDDTRDAASPGRIAAVLTEGAISQVRPVSPLCRHDLSVTASVPPDRKTGLAEAVAEVFWYDPAGALLRGDALALPASRIAATQRRRLLPPPGAGQAEIRVSVAAGRCVLQTVSLTSTDGLLGDDAWRSDPVSRARMVATRGANGTVWRNLGADAGMVTQVVQLASGDPLALDFAGAVAAGAPLLGVGFLDGTGAAVGRAIDVALEATAFARQPALLDVPPGARSAAWRLVLPAGAALRVETLQVTQQSQAVIPCGFIAQSPGELHVTAARIVYDMGSAPPPVAPLGGLVSPTPPGTAPGTGAGPCGCDEAPSILPVLAAMMRPLAAAREAAPAPSLTDIGGIGPARLRRLRAVGITTVSALAAASTEQVTAALAGPATTPDLSVTLIQGAKTLLAAHAAAGRS